MGDGVALPEQNLGKLIGLVARLRGPDGCPWDRAQDYDSVRGLVLEEAYEVVDAVSARDFDALADELGDLLFQVVFYSRLAEEEARFDFNDVVTRVYTKLVRRHPHVFGDVKAHSPEEALRSWNAVKAKEREAKGDSEGASILDGIASALPSSLEAYELGIRVAEVGFDWASVEDLLDKVEEEVCELREELKREGASATLPEGINPKIDEEVGDLMFSVANLARTIHSDPESCLRRANQKFKRRFRALENEIKKQGRNLHECSAPELESLWATVKSREEK